MNLKFWGLFFSALFSWSFMEAQLFPDSLVKPRMRVIIDNDFGGDPDGLFQLVHHVLSPSVEIRAIIGSHLKPGDGFDPSTQTAENAKKKVVEVLDLMGYRNKFSVYAGSNQPLEKTNEPKESDASRAIINEALRTDTKMPLYIVCGAGLTDLASALIKEPKIADKLTLIWIGGPEYAGTAYPPPGYTSLEYNLGIDLKAVQYVFNQSNINIWQVPRNSYRRVLLPYASLVTKVKNEGKIGNYLAGNLERVMSITSKWNINIGETYVIGDSPLVLLTALQSSFESDPSSCNYEWRPSPLVNDQGLYEFNQKGRNIRVYNEMDSWLLFEDFFSKLHLFNSVQK